MASTSQHVDQNGVFRKRGCNDQCARDHLDIEDARRGRHHRCGKDSRTPATADRGLENTK